MATLASVRSASLASCIMRHVSGRRGMQVMCAMPEKAAGSSTPRRKVLAVLYKAGAAACEPRLLGCVENELGLRQFLEDRGDIEYIVTADKEGANSEFDKHLVDAEVIIATPFHPAYLTKERIAKAPKLKLALTAGVGSDHVDLPAAAAAGITVAEVTGSNVVSVAEHAVMLILTLVRNYVAAHEQVAGGGWDVGAIAQHANDLEGKIVGTVGTGRIGQRIMRRLAGFDCAELLYSDYTRLPEHLEKSLNVRYVELDELVRTCDVITINCPLHKSTLGMFNKELIAKMKRGTYIVNTARGAICDRAAIAEACKSGQLGGYAGDVWDVQPAPKDHAWRTMPNNGMTAHYSGTTLDAQGRYAAGTKAILERYFAGEPQKPEDVIVLGGKLAAQYDESVKEGRSLEHAAGWEELLDKKAKK